MFSLLSLIVFFFFAFLAIKRVSAYLCVCFFLWLIDFLPAYEQEFSFLRVMGGEFLPERILIWSFYVALNIFQAKHGVCINKKILLENVQHLEWIFSKNQTQIKCNFLFTYVWSSCCGIFVWFWILFIRHTYFIANDEIIEEKSSRGGRVSHQRL